MVECYGICNNIKDDICSCIKNGIKDNIGINILDIKKDDITNGICDGIKRLNIDRRIYHHLYQIFYQCIYHLAR